MIYRIEHAATEDFDIIHADNYEEAFKEANNIDGGYLNIFEVDDNYENIRQVF